MKIVLTLFPMVKLPALKCKIKVLSIRATPSPSQEVNSDTQSWSIDLPEECRASTSAILVPLRV